jgi:site-specific recombinase XerC
MSGVDISGIKDMLGHAKISTTEIYNRITPEFLRPAANMLDMDKARDANKLLNRETVESKLPVAVERNKRPKLAV